MFKKKLIAFLSLGALAVIAGSFLYYDHLNNYEDPRVVPARKLVQQFEKLKSTASKDELFAILDKITSHYQNTSGYQDSYEIGVFDNDRAALYINMALHSGKSIEQKKSYLKQAQFFSEKAIDRYLSWKRVYGSLSQQELILRTSQWLSGKAFVERRVEQLLEAQIEIDRRLSVAYTNLGIILRHLGQPKQAADFYGEAIKLWEGNLAAVNNLRVLIGKKPIKPSLIRRLFPPERL